MGQPKGGKKLRRSGKHKAMYAAQFHRTAANKSRQAIKRRKKRELWELKNEN
jgi:hypothetical protein